MTGWGWTVVGLLAAWVCLCHINILILQRWVRDLGGGPRRRRLYSGTSHE